jgi:hypothetical protein
MIKKKTHEEFMQELKSIGNNKITVLGIYNGNKTPLLVECNKCHKQYYTQPSVLLHNSGCRDCMPHKSKPPVKKKKSEEQFLKEVEVVNPNVEILSEYKGASVKVQCKCKICNNIWETTPSVLLAGHGCRKCATKRNAEKGTLSHKEFMERFYKCNNQYVEIIGKYKGSDIKIKCKCLICGEEFETTPYRLLNGTKHEKCANKLGSEKRKCDYEDLKQRINNVNPNIELLGEYINFHTKMDFRCVCGEIHQATPIHLLRGGLCYKCGRHKSKGEDAIENVLKTFKYDYIKQYKPIKENIRLAFDFALYNSNVLVSIIEYDGEGHYKPIDFAGKGEEWANKNFEIYQLRDSIKDQYCKDNNIPLLRIPYWDYKNIDKILSDFLDTLQVSA